MNPEKCVRATKHGLSKLQEQIQPLRRRLKVLEDAHTKLSNLRYFADLQTVEVKTIPIGVTKKKLIDQEKHLAKVISKMSEEEARALFELLQGKI